MSTALKAIHDELMERRPDDASHDAASCLFCSPGVDTASAPSSGGSVSDKTYTEEEYNALSSQVATLEAKVVELADAAKESVVDAKVAEVKAELEAKVASVQSQLDTTTIECEAAKNERDAIVAYLEAEVASATEAAEREAKRDERVAAVKDAASFPDEYLEANADRFVAMSDEAFEAAIADWKAVAAKAPAKKTDETIPSATAMTAARSTDSGSTSVLSEVLGLRFAGIDTRTV